MATGQAFFHTYVQGGRIVDVGSQDVNGSLRVLVPKDAEYIGVDMEAGKNVDIVLEDPYKLPFEDNSVDYVVSTSCLEHCEMFWVLFLEMLRILKPEGLCYMNVPSKQRVHRYPVDCWRFLPDSGNALETWGRASGYNTRLLESFVLDTNLGDFVGVFVKDEEHDPEERMLYAFAKYSTHHYSWESSHA